MFNQKEYMKKYNKENNEAILEKKKKHYEENKEAIAEYKKKHYEENKEAILEKSKKHYEENKEVIAEKSKKYRKENKEVFAEKNKKYYEENKEVIAERKKKYYEENKKDICFKLNHLMSRHINKSLKNGEKQGRSWFKLVGYTAIQLMEHLKQNFQEGMNWDNHGFGNDKWHIDHRRPKSWFKFKTVNDPEFKKCWALENLQPKWQVDNLSKGNRFED